MIEVKLPEVGENIDSGTVVSVEVKVGDTVKKDQDLFELETEKASLPVPSPAAGVIKEILIAAGDEVKIGQVVLKMDEADAAPVKEKEVAPAPKEERKRRYRFTRTLSARNELGSTNHSACGCARYHADV